MPRLSRRFVPGPRTKAMPVPSAPIAADFEADGLYPVHSSELVMYIMDRYKPISR